MTVRPVPNPNLNPKSMKSYHNDKLGYRHILTCIQHPCFEDVDVLCALRMLKGIRNPTVRVIVQLRDYRKQEE